MHNLGQTRSSKQPNHLLLTPDTFVRTAAAGDEGLRRHRARRARRWARRFTQYTAEFEAGGELGGTRAQRFLFVMEGAVKLETPDKQFKLGARGYAYLPEALTHRIDGHESEPRGRDRKALSKCSHRPTLPQLIISHEDSVASHPLGDDPDLQVKCLLPDELSFDFAVNTMVYQPGAALSMVEMHVMEHGLLMLEGGGIYRLGDSWYPVTAGDFIWMGPWCPQWFGAIGKMPAKYLIYKDWNRHPLAGHANDENRNRFATGCDAEIEALASISDAEPPAVTRIVFTPADLKARAWLVERCEEAGLSRAPGRDWEHFRALEWFRSERARRRYGLAHRRDSECGQI